MSGDPTVSENVSQRRTTGLPTEGDLHGSSVLVVVSASEHVSSYTAKGHRDRETQ